MSAALQLSELVTRATAAPDPRHAWSGLGSTQTTFERAFFSGEVAKTDPEPESPRAAQRAELYRLRGWWAERSRRPRQSRCGRVRVAEHATVTVRDSWDAAGDALKRAASWSGVETCASCWSCAVCAPKVRSDRSRAVRMLDAWARSEGWQVTMMTLTVRHALGDDLEHVRRRLAAAWARVQRRTLWGSLLAAGAVFIRALEVTHGRAGWHPHYHVLILSPVALETVERDGRGEDAEAVEHVTLADAMCDQWSHAVALEIGSKYVPSAEHGVDWRVIGAGEYVAKLDLAMGLELTDAAGTKRARKGGRKPSEILRDAAAHAAHADAARKRGELALAQLHERAQRHDTRLYGEYERAMIGARLHTASAGLLAWWQAEADGERDEESIPVVDVTIPGPLFDQLRHIPGGLAMALERAENDAPHEAVAAWLLQLGPVLKPPELVRVLCGWDGREHATWADSVLAEKKALTP